MKKIWYFFDNGELLTIHQQKIKERQERISIRFWIGLLILSILTILLFGCGSDKVTISKEEYKQLKGDTIKSEYPKPVIIDGYTWEVTLGSDGHEYVDNNAHQEYICMHWVECKKCKVHYREK